MRAPCVWGCNFLFVKEHTETNLLIFKNVVIPSASFSSANILKKTTSWKTSTNMWMNMQYVAVNL